MLGHPWARGVGACLALAMVPLLGSCTRPQAIDEGGSLAATVESGGSTKPPTAEPEDRNPSAGEARGRVLLDEGFDGNTLDASIWNTCHWWQKGGCTIGSNEELE